MLTDMHLNITGVSLKSLTICLPTIKATLQRWTRGNGSPIKIGWADKRDEHIVLGVSPNFTPQVFFLHSGHGLHCNRKERKMPTQWKIQAETNVRGHYWSGHSHSPIKVHWLLMPCCGVWSQLQHRKWSPPTDQLWVDIFWALTVWVYGSWQLPDPFLQPVFLYLSAIIVFLCSASLLPTTNQNIIHNEACVHAPR